MATMAIAFGLMLTGCSSKTEKINEYSTEMSEYTSDFAETMDDFHKLNVESSVDPSIMSTNEWINDAAEALDDMAYHIEDIRSVEPPKGLEKSHGYVLEAMDSYEYAVNNYPESINDADVRKSCMDALKEGDRNMIKAGEELQKVTD